MSCIFKPTLEAASKSYSVQARLSAAALEWVNDLGSDAVTGSVVVESVGTCWLEGATGPVQWL